jgi:hypothetical protein
MWHDATGLLIWMSQSAYPSFVWQTYDYYYDATGAYWGAKKACEPLHIQWNSSSNSIKVVNTTANDLKDVRATARIYDLTGKEVPAYGKSTQVDVLSNNIAEAFRLNFNPSNLAYGKKAVASTSTELRDASLVTDGGAGSRWESEYADPQWIYVDLGKKEKIEKVILKWEVARAKEYELQISDDGKKWKTIHKENNSDGNKDEIKMKPVEARFVKVQCISRATNFGYSLYEVEIYGKQHEEKLTPLHFIRLELTDAEGKLISDNFYWRNGIDEQDFTLLNTFPEANISCSLVDKKYENNKGQFSLLLKNNSNSIAFANRIRLLNKETKERILPVIMPENYVTLMPGEEKIIPVEVDAGLLKGGADVLLKQYGKKEKSILTIE